MNEATVISSTRQSWVSLALFGFLIPLLLFLYLLSDLNLDDLMDTVHVEDQQSLCITPINLADLDTTITIKKFMKYEYRMPPDTLQLLTLAIRHPIHGKIGDITAVRVQHQCLFLEVMDVDGELFTIASTLFDKYGEVRLWLLDNEYHKGSGVWGRELNEGRLIFVFCVSVDPPVKNSTIASKTQIFTSHIV
jgi:hypothetical protein